MHEIKSDCLDRSVSVQVYIPPRPFLDFVSRPGIESMPPKTA